MLLERELGIGWRHRLAETEQVDGDDPLMPWMRITTGPSPSSDDTFSSGAERAGHANLASPMKSTFSRTHRRAHSRD
ncbi:hypothetical protein QN358_13960 [Subtercola sp. RTI3]|nr:hypothetical protein [Subtercola sp. RTI3]